MIRDPNEEELSAAREGRRMRQPGQDPKGLNICIMFWNGRDCAEMKTAMGGLLLQGKTAHRRRISRRCQT